MSDYGWYRLQLALKRLVIAALRALVRFGVALRPSPGPAAVSGTVVLLDRCLGIGDALMISPALRLLAPLGPVTVVTGLPPLLEWDGEWRHCRSWREMTAAVDTLVESGRVVLMPRLGLRGLTVLLMWRHGIPPMIVGLTPTLWLDTTSGMVGPIHGHHYSDGAILTAQNLLDRWGNLPDQGKKSDRGRLRPRCPPPGSPGLAAAEATAGIPVDRPVIALAPWATSRIRRWPLASWSELITTLAKARPDLAFVLLGSADERPAGAAITAPLAPNLPVINAMGQLSLLETTGVVARSVLLVACDNGLMHLGLGVETPVVALFGSTDPSARLTGARWRVAVDPELCPSRRAPCYPDLHRDPSCPTAIECLAGLTVDRVAGLALALLAEEKATQTQG